MSEQQIDITPYKVRRENVITNQQKTYEAKPNSDLASSILEKLTEIKGNLYPTHLNIPPHKFGQSLPTTPLTYNLHSPEMPSNPDRPISNFESFPRNETFGDLLYGSKSSDISPTTKIKSSPLYDSSTSNPKFQSISENFPLSNLEYTRTNPESLNPYKDNATPAFTNQTVMQELTPSHMYKSSNQLSSIPIYSSQASAEFPQYPYTGESTQKNQAKETRQSSQERQKSEISVEPVKTRSQILEEKKAALRKKQEEIIASQTSLDLAARVNQREILSPKLGSRDDKSIGSSTSKTQITEGKGSGGPKTRSQLISALEQALKTGQVDHPSKNEVDSAAESQQKSEQQLEALKKPTTLKKTAERGTEKAKPKTSGTKVSGDNVNKEYTGGYSTHEGPSIEADLSSSQQRRTTETMENPKNIGKTQTQGQTQKSVANKRNENRERETNVERGDTRHATSSAQHQVEKEIVPSFREAIKNSGILNSGNSSPSHEQLTEFTFTHQITGSDSSRQARRDSPVKKGTRESPMKKGRPDEPVKKSLNEISSDNSRQNSSTPKKDVILDKGGVYDEQVVHPADKKKTSKILDKQTPPKKKPVQQDEKRESSVGSYVTIEHERPERARNSKNTSISLPKQDQGEPSSTQQIPSRTFSNTPPKRETKEDFSNEKSHPVQQNAPVVHSPPQTRKADQGQGQMNAFQQQQNMNSSPQQLDQAQLQMLRSQNGPVFHSPAQARKDNQMQMPMNQNVQMFNSPPQMNNNMNNMNMMQMQMPMQGFQNTGMQSPPRMNNNPMQMQMNTGNPMQFQMPQMPMFTSPPMPNFGDFGVAEYQKYILMIMNYYETHMGHMKGIIAKQNEAFHHERQKNQILEQRNIELNKKIQNLENTMKNQPGDDPTQKELKTRYEVVMDELTALKRTLLAKQVNSQTEIAAPAPVVQKPAQEESRESNNLLYHEILSLRKDLENQRETMYDFKSSTRHLEGQIKDLEKMYLEELKNNAQVNNKREELQDALERYKTDYIKMDTLNKIILDGYEKTKRDLENMRNTPQLVEERYEPDDHQNVDQTQYTQQTQGTPYTQSNDRGRHVSMGSVHVTEERDRPRREIYIRSISPQRFDTEENTQEMLRNKQKAQESQVKNLMQWSGNTPQVAYPYNYTPSTGYGSSGYDSMNQNYGQNAYANNQPNVKNIPPTQTTAEKQKAAASTGGRGTRSHIVFPSFQRIEDNKEEIRRVEQRLAQLQQHRKMIENEIFKMPSVTKTLDQKKKKVGLDMELESIDNEIEDCKNVLRQYDVLNVK